MIEDESAKFSNKLLANKVMENLKSMLPSHQDKDKEFNKGLAKEVNYKFKFSPINTSIEGSVIIPTFNLNREQEHEEFEEKNADADAFTNRNICVDNIFNFQSDQQLFSNNLSCLINIPEKKLGLGGVNELNLNSNLILSKDNDNNIIVTSTNIHQSQITQPQDSNNNNNNNFLGKKTNRDPNEYAKILTNKHSLGDINCEEVILEDDKYSDDVQMILKYAEENHPFQLVIEFCQKFKWPAPEIFSYQINKNSENDKEIPIFKTTISVRNNSFKGEALGAQKKISKKKAAIHVITNMLEDNFVRDTMKMFVKGLIYRNEDNNQIKVKEYINEDDEELLMIKQDQALNSNDPEDNNEKERVEKLLADYHQNNPLIKLNFFKNKVKIPFSFTITQRGKSRIVTLYVGSEVFGIGEDHNLKVARYKASEEGLNKIKVIYGEDVLKTKEDRRNTKIYQIKEDIVPEMEKDLLGSYDALENFNQITSLLEEINKTTNENQFLQKKFEIFCLKLERNLIPINDFNEIEKIIAKLLYTNKSISMHFDNPILVGSFANNCQSSNHKVIDVLFTHKLKEKNMKDASDSLIKNFNLIFNDSIKDPNVIINNKRSEVNFDLDVSFPDKDYSFSLLIRSKSADGKDFLEYLTTHTEVVTANKKSCSNFFLLRRLLRLWRRKFNLLFLRPEIIDWIIMVYEKTSISDSLAKIFHKMSKDLQNMFKNFPNVPQVILDLVNNIINNEENFLMLTKSCNDSIIFISEGNFDCLFN